MYKSLGIFIFALLLVAPAAHAAAPSDVDTDRDGFPDAIEIANGYTPYGPGTLKDADADFDGLSDYDEIILFHTDPTNADTDGDGYADGLEVQHDYDPVVPDGAKLKKKIVINLKQQKLSYYIGPKPLGTYLVSTGAIGKTTPKGTFAVKNKVPRAWSASAGLWMPWWMSFIGTKYGIHELPEWPNGKKEGENHLGKPVSHGCIRLGVGPAKTLYDWADVGTQVVVQ